MPYCIVPAFVLICRPRSGTAGFPMNTCPQPTRGTSRHSSRFDPDHRSRPLCGLAAIHAEMAAVGKQVAPGAAPRICGLRHGDRFSALLPDPADRHVRLTNLRPDSLLGVCRLRQRAGNPAALQLPPLPGPPAVLYFGPRSAGNFRKYLAVNASI